MVLFENIFKIQLITIEISTKFQESLRRTFDEISRNEIPLRTYFVFREITKYTGNKERQIWC
jgi:hypothetical protein